MEEINTEDKQTVVTIPKTDMDHFKDIATSLIDAIGKKLLVITNSRLKNLNLMKKISL